MLLLWIMSVMLIMSGYKMFHNFAANHHKIKLKTTKCSVDAVQLNGTNAPINVMYTTGPNLSRSQYVFCDVGVNLKVNKDV